MFSESTWQIFPHGKEFIEEDDINVIKGGDLIRLRHTELLEYLSVDQAFNSENPEVYLHKYNGDYEEEGNTAKSIFEVELNKCFGRG